MRTKSLAAFVLAAMAASLPFLGEADAAEQAGPLRVLILSGRNNSWSKYITAVSVSSPTLPRTLRHARPVFLPNMMW